MRAVLKSCAIPDKRFNARQLRLGTKVELEHTTSRRAAKCIAKHHLVEESEARRVPLTRTRYYIDLLAMERRWRRR